jgi:hypothetical protein
MAALAWKQKVRKALGLDGLRVWGYSSRLVPLRNAIYADGMAG